MTIKNPSADDLFGKILPAGDYQVSLYAQTATSLNPGLCTIVCSKNIPSKANDNTGQNWQRINIPTLDPLLRDGRHELRRRASASRPRSRPTRSWRQDQVSLPLDPLPNIVLWSDKITGPVGDNPMLSMFWNMNAVERGGLGRARTLTCRGVRARLAREPGPGHIRRRGSGASDADVHHAADAVLDPGDPDRVVPAVLVRSARPSTRAPAARASKDVTAVARCREQLPPRRPGHRPVRALARQRVAGRLRRERAHQRLGADAWCSGPCGTRSS